MGKRPVLEYRRNQFLNHITSLEHMEKVVKESKVCMLIFRSITTLGIDIEIEIDAPSTNCV
jgi:myo-inositol-1-phosphate synthase